MCFSEMYLDDNFELDVELRLSLTVFVHLIVQCLRILKLVTHPLNLPLSCDDQFIIAFSLPSKSDNSLSTIFYDIEIRKIIFHFVCIKYLISVQVFKFKQI